LGSNQGGVLYWKETGEVSIGKFLANYTLDVDGDIYASDGVESGGAIGSGNHAFVSNYTNGDINWLDDKKPDFVNLLGTDNEHAGFGIADGENIHSPVIWMWKSGNDNNALKVKTMQYQAGINSGNDLLVVKENGKVGINVSNPTFALDVNGSVKFDVNAFTDGEIKFEPHNNFHRIVFNELRLYENGIGDRFTITGGNVGINKTNPSSALDVNGSVKASAEVSATKIRAISASANDAFVVENSSTTGINFKVKGNGYVYAREVEITMTNFPDYVFEKDYDLMSLDNLRTHIKENKHLPGIKSAKEVKANGIGQGELSKLQMEKIEELTLYILQLEERIKKLESSNEKE
jgi:hypothetical protein